MQAGLPPSFSCLETWYLLQPSSIRHLCSLTLISSISLKLTNPVFLGSKGENGESVLSAHCRKAMGLDHTFPGKPPASQLT